MLKKIQLSVDELLFYSAYSIWLFSQVVFENSLYRNFPLFKPFARVCMLGACGLLVYKFILQNKISKKNLMVLLTLLFFVGVIGILGGESYMMISSLLLIYSAHTIQQEKLFRFIFIATSIFIFIIICSFLVHILPNIFHMRNQYTRYNLGFIYPTYLSKYLFFLTLLLINIKSLFRYRNLIILFIINVIVYFLTNTRITFVLTTVLIGISALYKYFGMKTTTLKKISKISQILFLILYIGLIVLMIVYNEHSFLKFFDKLLSGRLGLAHEAFKLYDITLFGQRIPWNSYLINGKHPSDYLFIDSVYLKYFFNYGIIGCLFSWYLMRKLFEYAAIKKQFTLLLATIAICVFGLIDLESLVLSFNGFLIVLSYYFKED